MSENKKDADATAPAVNEPITTMGENPMPTPPANADGK